MKKAAMFGLDARIALAIFGALSVISGAALYSAIQNAKVTAYIAEVNEIGKAWEQYYLDTGSNLARQSTDSTNLYYYTYKIGGLVTDPGVTGWKGPYLSYENVSYYLIHPDYNNIHISEGNNATDWSRWNTSSYCRTSTTCALWIEINGHDTDDLAKGIDQYIDGGDGAEKGRFRYSADTGAEYKHRYYYKYTTIEQP